MPLLLTLISALMPLITHLVDHLMSKDTSTMSVEELDQHKENLACASGACDLIKKIKA